MKKLLFLLPCAMVACTTTKSDNHSYVSIYQHNAEPRQTELAIQAMQQTQPQQQTYRRTQTTTEEQELEQLFPKLPSGKTSCAEIPDEVFLGEEADRIGTRIYPQSYRPSSYSRQEYVPAPPRTTPAPYIRSRVGPTSSVNVVSSNRYYPRYSSGMLFSYQKNPTKIEVGIGGY